MENKFNLVDEPWIPVAGKGEVSLRQVFTDTSYRSLVGNPVQKIVLMKLLLAIAQAAVTPENIDEWKKMGYKGLSEQCLIYLEKWHDRFYLYGETPFLQMPAIKDAECQSYGAVIPEVATGNTTVLSQIQMERPLVDAEKALLLVTLMSFAMGGKKTDNAVALTPGYAGKRNDKGKPSSGKPGPAMAQFGLLHTLLQGSCLAETLWLNVLLLDDLRRCNQFPQGMGRPPWEQMPAGEDCAIARSLRQSLLGRLVPLSRFCLLTEKGLHYSEGIAHDGHLQGMSDPTVSVDHSGKSPRALWANPEKKPWRELTSLLAFMDTQSSQGYQCLQLQAGLDRARDSVDQFAVWAGGLRVSSNAGEQYATGGDDFVESTVWLRSEYLGSLWFAQLQHEMTALDGLAKRLYGKVSAYLKEQKVDNDKIAAHATHLFWQLAERQFQNLVDHCGADEDSRQQRQHLRQTFATCLLQAYDQYCPKDTSRQLDAWAKCRPSTHDYLNQKT